MASPSVLCPVCAASLALGAVCSRCGYEMAKLHPAICLPVGTVLHGEYTVGNILGKPGGFGITYSAWLNLLEQSVAIKEYLPTALAGRAADSRTVRSHSSDHESDFRFGIEQFLREARTLARLTHPNIVRVRGFSEEYGTAYLIMDYYAGMGFDRLLEERGGRLPQVEAVEILLPILDALQHIHELGLLHRDVKPSNLYLKADRTPILLDFGAARSALVEQTQSVSLIRTPGYSPLEQHHTGGNQGPWTDVYAAAATLYKLLTGVVPPNAIERIANDMLVPPEKLVPEISEVCSRAVLAGLELRTKYRPQSAKDFRDRLLKTEVTRKSRARLTVSLPSTEQLDPPQPPATQQSVPERIEPSSRVPNDTVGPKFGSPYAHLPSTTESRRKAFGTSLAILLLISVTSILWPRKKEEPMEVEETPAVEIPPAEAAPPMQRREDPTKVEHGPTPNRIDGLTYVWIPPGSFLMGCESPTSDCISDELPRHGVTFSAGFWLGQSEVTVAAYERFVHATGRQMPAPLTFNESWAKKNHPIVNVTWNEAHSFCEWSQGRLPSESEWEYSARGGLEGAKYPWGNDAPTCEKNKKNGAWFKDNEDCNSWPGTGPTAQFLANAFGLYDMAGNIFEWCEDRAYSAAYDGAPADGSALISGESPLRVLRGGSWATETASLRVARRNWEAPEKAFSNLGFRCARGTHP